jgi:Fe-S-cluster containining protein
MAKTPKSKRAASPEPLNMKKHRGATTCIRCGTCCTKGGPCFHHTDKQLIDDGAIHTRYLYTLRKGELAFDNVKGSLVPVESDIIKIKGKDDSWTCVFFDEEKKVCAVYKDRPLECRALKCWDTRELEAMYSENRLCREDLISDIEGLWDLINDHQMRCDYEKIHRLVKALDGRDNKQARRELIETIQYDMEIRKLVVAKGGLDAEMLDFLFGRPLVKTLESFGVRVQLRNQKINLVSK